MKTKSAKPKATIHKLLLRLAITGGFLMANIVAGQAYAAMSFAALEKELNSPMRNYCAGVRGTNYEKCLGNYTAGASAVYYAASEKEVNKQLQTICTPPIQNWTLDGSKSDCGAFVEGAGTAQDILGKPFYNGGGSKPDKPKPDKPKPDPDKPPPITECNKLDADLRKECKRDYRKCIKEDTPKKVRDCKKEVIQNYKKKQADKEEAEKKKEEEDKYKGQYLCGNIRTENNGTSGPLSDDNYYTKFNFGCVGEAGPKGLNPIEDLAFAILRFLSVGVGIAVVVAVIGSGIQYIASEGNAEVTTKAKNRIRSAIIGLIFYIFAFSLFQYLVPGGMFWPGNWFDLELISRLL